MEEPGKARPQTVTMNGITMKVYSVQEKDGAYGFTYADMPISSKESVGQTQTRLQGGRDGVLKALNAKMDKAETVGGDQARHLLRGEHRPVEGQARVPAEFERPAGLPPRRHRVGRERGVDQQDGGRDRPAGGQFEDAPGRLRPDPEVVGRDEEEPLLAGSRQRGAFSHVM